MKLSKETIKILHNYSKMIAPIRITPESNCLEIKTPSGFYSIYKDFKEKFDCPFSFANLKKFVTLVDMESADDGCEIEFDPNGKFLYIVNGDAKIKFFNSVVGEKTLPLANNYENVLSKIEYDIQVPFTKEDIEKFKKINTIINVDSLRIYRDGNDLKISVEKSKTENDTSEQNSYSKTWVKDLEDWGNFSDKNFNLYLRIGLLEFVDGDYTLHLSSHYHAGGNNVICPAKFTHNSIQLEYYVAYLSSSKIGE